MLTEIGDTMNNTTKNVVNCLSEGVAWNRFAKMVCAVGSQFNDAQKRFMKGEIIEQALAECSRGMLQYVGQSQDGCDFLLRSLHNTRIEMKFDAGEIFTPKGKLKKNITIKLMNSHGTNTHAALPATYADFLIVASTRGVLIIPKTTFKKYITISGDGIVAKFPSAKATILVGPDVMDICYQATVDFSSELAKLTEKFIESIK